MTSNRVFTVGTTAGAGVLFARAAAGAQMRLRVLLAS
jgi:hypothetical protein